METEGGLEPQGTAWEWQDKTRRKWMSERLKRFVLSPSLSVLYYRAGVSTLFCVGIYLSNEKLTEIYQVKNK